MPPYNFYNSIDQYASCLAKLEDASPNPTDELVLDVLLSRDAVQYLFSNSIYHSGPEQKQSHVNHYSLLERLFWLLIPKPFTDPDTSITQDTRISASQVETMLELDGRLKRQEEVVARTIDLVAFSSVLNPPKEAWW